MRLSLFSRLSLPLVSLLIFSACTKEKGAVSNSSPRVRTPTVTLVSYEADTFAGEAFSPTVSGFSPATASFGDLITITGTNFSPNPRHNKVMFGQVQATVQSATPTQLTVKVPTDLAVASSVVVVTVEEQQAFSPQEFTLLAPVIEEVSQLLIESGKEITIMGQNFNPVLENNVVMIKDFAATVVSATKTQLRVLQPAEVDAPDNALYVTVAGQQAFPSQKVTAPIPRKRGL